MIRRDMRKEKNAVRRSKDYNRCHDQEEIAAYKAPPAEAEEYADCEADTVQQAPPGCHSDEVATTNQGDSGKGVLKIGCSAGPASTTCETVAVAAEMASKKALPPEKSEVLKAASTTDTPTSGVQLGVTGMENVSPIDSSRPINMEEADTHNKENSRGSPPFDAPTGAFEASIPHYSKPNKAIRAKISLSHGEAQERLREIQKSLPG